jgi:hypothetical protein
VKNSPPCSTGGLPSNPARAAARFPKPRGKKTSNKRRYGSGEAASREPREEEGEGGGRPAGGPAGGGTGGGGRGLQSLAMAGQTADPQPAGGRRAEDRR